MRAADAKAQHWRQRLADQQASGLSIARWCREHDCCRQSFYRWQLNLERLELPPAREAGCPAMGRAPAAQPMAGFMEVLVGSPPPGPLACEPPACEPLRLRLIGGRELLVPVSMPAASLAQLLVALESCATGSGVWEGRP